MIICSSYCKFVLFMVNVVIIKHEFEVFVLPMWIFPFVFVSIVNLN